jgi:hypothetical protein
MADNESVAVDGQLHADVCGMTLIVLCGAHEYLR